MTMTLAARCCDGLEGKLAIYLRGVIQSPCSWSWRTFLLKHGNIVSINTWCRYFQFSYFIYVYIDSLLQMKDIFIHGCV